MATTFSPNTAAFNGEEIKSASEAIFTEAFSNLALTEVHEIIQDIKVNKQIVFVGGLANMLGKDSGACNPTANANTIPMSEKVWTPADVSDRLSFCWKALEDTFWAYALKTGVEKADVSTGEFMAFIGSRIEEALLEMVYRIAWFNDTEADNVSGGGIITDGTDVAFFDKIDGIWKQIFTAVASDSTKKTLGLDSRNGQASKALQAFTATDTTNKVVTNTLLNMTYEADERLMSKAGAFIIATKSVGDQFKRELRAFNSAFTTERIEGGIEILRADGLEVRIFSLWDRIIRAYEDNGTTWNLPHRALLTVKENIPIGTADAMSFGDFDVFYDKTDKVTYVDIATAIDAKLLEDMYFQAAY